MSEQTRWSRRDIKRRKRRDGMRIDGRSIFTITDLQRKRYKRAEEVRNDEVAERS